MGIRQCGALYHTGTTLSHTVLEGVKKGVNQHGLRLQMQLQVQLQKTY